ncbi:MAG: transglutaminase domain-containing protein [Deltaproteobacteria bacterium]|nr:transglutaminase domain-containing protein [Deltaproteobacteria bacterium]
MKRKSVVRFIIIIFWVVMIAILFKKNLHTTYKITPLPYQPEKGEKVEKEWYGIYFKGEKIGYNIREEKETKEEIRIKEKTFLKMNIMDTIQKISLITDSLLNKDYSLKNFDFYTSSGIMQIRVKGKVRDHILDIDIISSGNKTNQKIHLKSPIYLSSSINGYLSHISLKPGMKFEVPFFDPSSLDNRMLPVEVIGKEKVKIHGKSVDAIKIKLTYGGMDLFLWMDNSKKTIKEQSPMGFVMIKEKKEVALANIKSPKKAIDIIKASSIPIDKPIKNQEKLKMLVVNLSGFNKKGMDLDGERQSFKEGNLIIKKENISKIKKVLTDDKFLFSTPFIQSDNPEIKEIAKKIIGNERKRLKQIKLILNWMNKNIKKEPILSIPNALEVLKKKRGDCNEHAVLFTALARSISIPTRIAIGVVYLDGAFFYHAWCEVLLDKWITVDPVFNQIPADVTHIRFILGDIKRWVEINRLLGKLKIKVVDAK